MTESSESSEGTAAEGPRRGGGRAVSKRRRLGGMEEKG